MRVVAQTECTLMNIILTTVKNMKFKEKLFSPVIKVHSVRAYSCENRLDNKIELTLSVFLKTQQTEHLSIKPDILGRISKKPDYFEAEVLNVETVGTNENQRCLIFWLPLARYRATGTKVFYFVSGFFWAPTG